VKCVGTGITIRAKLNGEFSHEGAKVQRKFNSKRRWYHSTKNQAEIELQEKAVGEATLTPDSDRASRGHVAKHQYGQATAGRQVVLTFVQLIPPP